MNSINGPAAPKRASAKAGRLKGSRYVVFFAFLALAACGSQRPSPETAEASAPPQRIPIGQLPQLDMDAILQHTKVLSSDEFEGRAPGTKGEELIPV